MNVKEFDKIVDAQIDHIRRVLKSKAGEYATDEDRLHNFRISAALAEKTPAEECWGFARKHIVSVMSMVNQTARGKTFPAAVWNEKVGDLINYAILLKACLSEKASVGR